MLNCTILDLENCHFESCKIVNISTGMTTIILSIYFIILNVKICILDLIFILGLLYSLIHPLYYKVTNNEWLLTASVISSGSFILMCLVLLNLNELKVFCRAIWLIAVIASALTYNLFFHNIPVIPSEISDVAILGCLISFFCLLCYKPCRRDNNSKKLNTNVSVFIQLLLAAVAFSYRIDPYFPSECSGVLLHSLQLLVVFIILVILTCLRKSPLVWQSGTDTLHVDMTQVSLHDSSAVAADRNRG